MTDLVTINRMIHVNPVEAMVIHNPDHGDSEGLGYVPNNLHAGLARWALLGLRPGSFLTAVLENDLRMAVFRFSPGDLQELRYVVSYIYNGMPSLCHGSVAKVAAWEKKGGLFNAAPGGQCDDI